MPQPQLATSPQIHPLSHAASNLVCRIPGLFHRLRALESEEAELNEQAHRLWAELVEDALARRPNPTISTPVSKVRTRATHSVSRKARRTPPHVDPRNIETPVKNFLLVESLALAMSVRSKRRGRIFLGGDSTEFGEKR